MILTIIKALFWITAILALLSITSVVAQPYLNWKLRIEVLEKQVKLLLDKQNNSTNTD